MIKVILSGAVVTAACVLAGATLRALPLQSKTYYTLIHKRDETQISSDWYSYEVLGVTKKGRKKQFDLNVFSEVPLEEGVLIEAVYSEERGVLSYTEIDPEQVPAGVLAQLK